MVPALGIADAAGLKNLAPSKWSLGGPSYRGPENAQQPASKSAPSAGGSAASISVVHLRTEAACPILVRSSTMVRYDAQAMRSHRRLDGRERRGVFALIALVATAACSLDRNGSLSPGVTAGGDTAADAVASTSSGQQAGTGGSMPASASVTTGTASEAASGAGGTGGGSGGAGGGGLMPQVLEASFSPALAFVDNAYDGSQASMQCVALAASGSGGVTVASVEVRLALQHSQVGNLVFKVFDPSNFEVRVMSRPGHKEMMDDGAGDQTGYIANADPAYPLTFQDGAKTSAEDLGKNLAATDTVCKDGPKLCAYKPEPDKGPGFKLSDFAGKDPKGTWKVCVADAANAGLGSLHAVTLTLGLK